MHKTFFFVLALLAIPSLLFAADLTIPENLKARAVVINAERDSLWEKTLVVTFPERRRTLSTFDGFVEAMAAINHSAHPLLWEKVGKKFMSKDGRGGKAYTEFMREKTARDFNLQLSDITMMATAADMDNLAVVTKEFKPLTVTVLVTAGAKSNAIRTGVDEGRYIEGEEPKGTINIMLLTNARLTDGAMARAIVTITEAKTAALEDLKVPSTYTKNVQATGTGTDSVTIVSGTTGPKASYAGGHSKLGELIGKATYEAVVEALGKQNGFLLPGAKPYVTENSIREKAAIAAAEKWLGIIDQDKFAESWKASSEYLRQTVSPEQWQKALQPVREAYGKPVLRRLFRTLYTKTPPGSPTGEYVIIEFNTSFENNKTGVETVTPKLDKDGAWRVYGYFVK